jgi:hypothetical protein
MAGGAGHAGAGPAEASKMPKVAKVAGHPSRARKTSTAFRAQYRDQVFPDRHVTGQDFVSCG